MPKILTDKLPKNDCLQGLTKLKLRAILYLSICRHMEYYPQL